LEYLITIIELHRLQSAAW